MKSVKEIITHMSNTPSYSKLKNSKKQKSLYPFWKIQNSIINDTFAKMKLCI